MKEYQITLKYISGGTLYEQVTNTDYGDGTTIDYTKESNEEFFRVKLTGNFKFANSDYDFIMNAAFDQKITFLMQENIGGLFYEYYTGYFYRTDCKVNVDNKIIEVAPTPDDLYTDFLGAIDKEVDLIKLAPKITPVVLDKRPCLQLYAAGQGTISCVLSNMHWEQECEVITDTHELTDTYKFADWGYAMTVKIGGTHTPTIPEVLAGIIDDPEDVTLTSGTTRLYARLVGSHWWVEIYINNVLSFSAEELIGELTFPKTVTLNAVGSATGTCILSFEAVHFFARLISDVDSIAGVDTLALPLNDMAGSNRNYKRVSPITRSGDLAITINTILSNTPTRWGLYDSGKYYTSPLAVTGMWFPIYQNIWSRGTFWISQSLALSIFEEDGRASVTLRDAYDLKDVIEAILAEVAPYVYWSGAGASEFLFGTNPLDESYYQRLVVPKSNILNINYTEPAQKATITLRQIFDMLRTCYCCYWWLEGVYLRIEHIQFFRQGHRYIGAPGIGADLTTKVAARNGKTWAYLTSKYQFDKVDMPCRYEFGWMDDATLPFEGLPMDMKSNYVNQGRVDKFVANKFDADVDYLMINPGGVSKDGFVLLEAEIQNIIFNPITIANTTSRRTILTYDAPVGERVDVVIAHSGYGKVFALDANDDLISTIWNWSTSGSSTATQWTLPPGTAKIAVQCINIEDTFTLKEFYPSKNKVVYWDWKPDPNNATLKYVLQNGTVSFAYLQKWYAYNMPCQNYAIGSESKVALGIAKNRTQEVIFPTDGYFDVDYLVKTNLGNGKIRKLSINLSSKIGKATLEYDLT